MRFFCRIAFHMWFCFSTLIVQLFLKACPQVSKSLIVNHVIIIYMKLAILDQHLILEMISLHLHELT
jgi:hypothetical protein